MNDLMQKINTLSFLKVGEIVEGKIVGKGRSAVYLDLGILGTGIIYGKEYQATRDLLRKYEKGEKLFAKIISLENEDGYIELSASKAGQEFAWDTIKEKKDKEETIKVKILGANKGGLLTKIINIPAFLPVSHLSSENYPKIEGGDSTKILRELQKFIGIEMDVRILDFNQREEKLIVSEKIKEIERTRELLKNYNVGDVVEGKVTGIADFGAFISFGDGIEGLIHISEMSWQAIKDPSSVVKEGEIIKAKIIEINNDRPFLSLKALDGDPWEKIGDKYSKKDVIRGKVSKINPFGAFIQLISSKNNNENQIQGLCHISEFGTLKNMTESLLIDKEYDFEIISLEPKEHRMILKPIKEIENRS